MAVPVVIGMINVNQINTNGAVSSGIVQQSGWSAQRKTDNGVGQQVGCFLNTANCTIILDPDVNDGNMFVPDITPSVQGQAL